MLKPLIINYTLVCCSNELAYSNFFLHEVWVKALEDVVFGFEGLNTTILEEQSAMTMLNVTPTKIANLNPLVKLHGWTSKTSRRKPTRDIETFED